ncbi:unnamed protein product [Tilletia controversa]|uniref:IMS import disulfide relay-system CHCH-CHCH-like Cx9C domain-containing protein n=3 Tax=Tilletia TaxID=13289 RepID=A0A8X7MQC9_9BASI|nr:hypothetical protein CF336_g6147 [Tilletia laevis]KAE8193955.1 hypothetical protein CF328_g4892 [Tilletia controversa]KAE8256396.1 hypothetical protein A4X03_0g5405 [Tilletia caries]KAE8193781.1 hypothetical protein CF335_g5502 [Tilletia laevis]KAE8245572.1 hypothetical protein A4X06_0g5582 [Tilletia controversa]
MEDSLEAVSRHCSQQLMNYQRCLISNPASSSSSTPNTACDEAKRELTDCAATAAPVLARLRELCAPKIRAYDACLSAHGDLDDDAFTAKCGPTLLDLHRCTQTVRSEIEHGGAAGQQRGAEAFLGAHGSGSSPSDSSSR